MKYLRNILALSIGVGIILLFSAVGGAADNVTYTGQKITFRFSSHIPSTNKEFKTIIDPWVNRLKETSNNKLDIKLYMGGVLNDAKDGFKASVSDVTDITHGYPQYATGSFHLCHAIELPFAFPNAYVASFVAEKLYPKYFKNEYENMGVYLSSYNASPAYNLLSKKPIRKLEDIKGLKIRSPGGLATEMIKRLGAIPVFITTSELYSSFQSGIIDAVLLHDAGINAYRLYEVGKYKTKLQIAIVGTPFCLNRKTFDRLPPDLKRVFYNNLRVLSQFSARGYMSGDENAHMVIEKAGVETITLSTGEFARWRSALMPMWEEFIVKNEAKGLPAKELIKDLKALSNKYADWTPQQLMELVEKKPISGIISGM